MSLYKRGETWWIYITHQSKRVRRSTGTADKKEAQRIHDELKAELWNERPVSEKSWLDACTAWLKAADRDMADKYRLRSFNDRYPDRALSAATAESFEAALEDKGAATYQRYRNMVVAILNTAKAKDWIEKVPRIASRKAPPGRIRWLTREEWTRLYIALPDHLKPLAKFAISTGLRQANVTQLEWSQVDMARRVTWIHADQSKSRKPIGIPLSDDAIEVLKGQIGKDETWVFPYRGKPIVKIKSAWLKALERAGLGHFDITTVAGEKHRVWVGDFTWHDLRHTWASWHVMSGTPLEVLQKLGGWSDIRMVLRYAHLAPEYLAQYAGNSKPYSPTIQNVA